MGIRALVILAEGFEEIEAVTPVDILRRGGIQVTVAGLGRKILKGSRGVSLEADCLLEEVSGSFDAVICPGGLKGSENLAASKEVRKKIIDMNAQGKIIAGLCAAPALVFASSGILSGKKATCYPGFEKNFPPEAVFSDQRVVVDGNLLTSRGPGTAFEFSLILVALLSGKETALKIAEKTLFLWEEDFI